MRSPDDSGRPSCAVRWGACPAHGNTLVHEDGRTRCSVCGRRWPGDRLGTPCDEPAELAIIVDSEVDRGHRLCRGHAIAATGQTPPWVDFVPDAGFSLTGDAAPR